LTFAKGGQKGRHKAACCAALFIPAPLVPCTAPVFRAFFFAVFSFKKNVMHQPADLKAKRN